MKKLTIIALFAALASPCVAVAASTDWYEVEGGKVRIVTDGVPDSEGNLRGAIDIRLQPGWKTYWRDPGEAGIPPRIDVAGSLNVQSASIGFPTPRHFDDGLAKWAGYAHSVALPVTFRVTEPEGAVIVTADLLLGICESICIPVSASFELDPLNDPDNAQDRHIVEAAFASLPGASSADFGVQSVRPDATGLEVAVAAPGEAAELFVAAPDDWQVGAPKFAGREQDRLIFHLKVLSRPADGRGDFLYTLSAGDSAVDGRFALP